MVPRTDDERKHLGLLLNVANVDAFGTDNPTDLGLRHLNHELDVLDRGARGLGSLLGLKDG